MDPSVHQPRLKAAFVALVSVVLAVFLGLTIGSEDYLVLLVGVVLVGVAYLWFFSGRFFWVLTIASFFLGGTFPILRGQFTPFQILMVMGLLKFVMEDVVLRRVRLKLPSRFDLLMIAGFMGVIVVHGISDRFGMRFLGSTVWGGRHYVNVFVGLAAFFVIQSIPMRRGLWAKFPYVVLAVASFDLFIALLTTVVPASIYVIFPFYSAVSTGGMQEVLLSNVDPVYNRIGAIGNWGVFLMLLVLSGVSIQALLHPSNFGRLATLMLAGVATLASGFRTSVVHALLAAFVAGIRDLRYAALLLVPAIAAVLFFLSAVNSEIVALPKPIQRAMAFVPGDWDFEMAQDVRASNDFRFRVWNLWWQQYFPQQPLLGRGFGFKMEWTKRSIRYGDAADYQQMIETGNIHNGFLAALDTFGIIGTIFFVAWMLVMLVRAMRIPFDGRGGEHRTLRFIALYLAVTILFYWIGATSIGTSLPGLFALAGLFLRLRNDLLRDEPKQPKIQRIEPRPRRFRRELVRA